MISQLKYVLGTPNMRIIYIKIFLSILHVCKSALNLPLFRSWEVVSISLEYYRFYFRINLKSEEVYPTMRRQIIVVIEYQNLLISNASHDSETIFNIRFEEKTNPFEWFWYKYIHPFAATIIFQNHLRNIRNDVKRHPFMEEVVFLK